MAYFAIIDTGYISTAATGTQAPVIANSGAAITLKTASLGYGGAANVDENSVIGSNSQAVIGVGSVSNDKLTLSGVLNTQSSSDMALLIPLNALKKTYGVKLLYYADTTDGFYDITDQIGDANKNDVHKTLYFSGTATPHLHVIVTNVQFDQGTSSHLRYTISMVVTE